MNHEFSFIYALLQKGDFSEVVHRKIDERYFKNDDTKKAFKFISDFWQKYGKLPKIKTFEEKIGVEVKKAKEPFGYYCDKLKEKNSYLLITKGMEKVNKILDEDVGQAREELNKLTFILQKDESSRDVSFKESLGITKKEYLERKEREGITGYSYGYRWLDRHLSGLNPEDFLVIVARQKSGKTFLACVLANNLMNQGLNVMFSTLEMSESLIRRRLMAIRYKLPYGRFKEGNLTDFEEKKLRKVKEDDDKAGDIKIVSDIYSTSSLLIKIKQCKPDVVFVDGFYLLETKSDSLWEKITEISRGLRKVAQITRVPLICTTQLNRKALLKSSLPELHHISFADAIGQDATAVLAMFQNDKLKDSKHMVLRLIGGRETELTCRAINWNLEKMDFSQLTRKESDRVTMPYLKGRTGDEVASDGAMKEF